jgi:hypothetical protein
VKPETTIAKQRKLKGISMFRTIKNRVEKWLSSGRSQRKSQRRLHACLNVESMEERLVPSGMVMRPLPLPMTPTATAHMATFARIDEMQMPFIMYAVEGDFPRLSPNWPDGLTLTSANFSNLPIPPARQTEAHLDTHAIPASPAGIPASSLGHSTGVQTPSPIPTSPWIVALD